MERKKGVVDKCRSISLSFTGRTRLMPASTPTIIARYHGDWFSQMGNRTSSRNILPFLQHGQILKV
jgi:hypothetical protein